MSEAQQANTLIHVRPIAQLNTHDLHRLVTGYTTDYKYQVSKRESDEQFVLALELVPLSQPYHKRYDHLDAETLKLYRQVLASGFSFGAYIGEECIGITLAELRYWNKSLWVWELHVAESHRRRRIGQQLIDTLAEKARAVGLRALICETQNTNIPAIRFYQKMGFHIEGIDLSYYSNDDFPDGEIAIFMKKRIGP